MFAPSLFPTRERSDSSVGGARTPVMTATHQNGGYSATAQQAAPTSAGLDASWSGGLRQRRYFSDEYATPGHATEAASSRNSRRSSNYSGGSGRGLGSAPPTASLWDEMTDGFKDEPVGADAEHSSFYGGHVVNSGARRANAFAGPTAAPSAFAPLPTSAGRFVQAQQQQQQPLFSPRAPSYVYSSPGQPPYAATTEDHSRAPTERQKYERWVLVFGFPVPPQQQQEPPLRVLDEFRRFGDVVDHHLGRGNWCFLRFAAKWQAEKAIAQGAVLVDNSVVGCMRVTPDVALKFALYVDDLGASLCLASYPDRAVGADRHHLGGFSFFPFRDDQRSQRQQQLHVSGAFDADQQRFLSSVDKKNPPPYHRSGGGLCARLVQYFFATDLHER